MDTDVYSAGSRGRSRPEGTSDNVLSRVLEWAGAQGGELVPVPQEAPIVLACVHDEPAEEPAPCLLPKGLLDFPLGDVVTDVYQLDQEDVGHARCDDHRVPHAGEGQGRAGRGRGWVRTAGFFTLKGCPILTVYTCTMFHQALEHLPQLSQLEDTFLSLEHHLLNL